MSNFEIIKDHAPVLFEYCYFAEKYLYDDPDSSLVKLRKFAELAVREIYRQHEMPEDQKNFYEIATDVKFYKIVPEDIYRAINFLRIEGNKGAHPKYDVKKKQATRNMAIATLKEAFNISVWMFKKYFNGNEPIAEFNLPSGGQFDDLTKKARQGDPDAQFGIGLKFFLGRNIQINYTRAAHWFRESAEQGHARAQAYLGHLYLSGHGVNKSEKEALKWINKSIKDDEPIAQTLLGQMYLEGTGIEKNPQKAIKWLQKAAQQDDPIAQCCLGQIYQYGVGVEQDYEVAFKWYFNASQFEEPLAFCSLGLLYEEGKGVKQDFHEAFKWYLKAADEGIDSAIAAVGAFYLNGVGCKKDIEKALKYLKIASDKESVIAFLNLGLFYKNDKYDSFDLNKAIDWLLKASESGSIEGQYELADSILMAHELGIKTPFTIIDARNWMLEAEKHGHPKAKKVMAEINNIRQREIENHKKLAIALTAFRENLQGLFSDIVKHQNLKKIDYSNVGRNDPCPCKSGKKYKQCCMKKNVR